jgi:DNA-binding HxlR family transcriptional regulator/putative sterol carrier protein
LRDHAYNQYCALAQALDTVGDRWTLLIVRELRPGPRRFTDLVDGLPGISRNLLTERLRNLEDEGLIARKDLPPPAARQVYELTDEGRELAAAIGPLVAWGAGRMRGPASGQAFQARWAAFALASTADREAAKGVNETYQYVVGDTAFHFVVEDGSVDVRDGQADDAAVTVTTDEETWAELARSATTTSSATRSGKIKISGDREAAKRLRRIFSRPGDLRRRARSEVR